MWVQRWNTQGFAAGTGFTSKRQWIETAAVLKQEGGKWIATAIVPPGTTACFMNVSSGKLVATSDYLQL